MPDSEVRREAGLRSALGILTLGFVFGALGREETGKELRLVPGISCLRTNSAEEVATGSGGDKSG